MLNNLWGISKQDAENTVNILWAYSLVQVTNKTISLNNNTQHCVEVHAIISIECMDRKGFSTLSPFLLKTATSVSKGLRVTFQESYGVNDPSSLTPVDYLEYKLSEIENCTLPFYLKVNNTFTVSDLHTAILTLQEIKNALLTPPYNNLLP